MTTDVGLKEPVSSGRAFRHQLYVAVVDAAFERTKNRGASCAGADDRQRLLEARRSAVVACDRTWCDFCQVRLIWRVGCGRWRREAAGRNDIVELDGRCLIREHGYRERRLSSL